MSDFLGAVRAFNAYAGGRVKVFYTTGPVDGNCYTDERGYQ
jgi:hypothetical protein